MGGRADLPSFDDLTPAPEPEREEAASAGVPQPPDAGPERTSIPAAADRPAAGPADGDTDPDYPHVVELLETVAKGLRAHRLYHTNNQAYQRFISAVHAAFARLWERMDALELAIDDRSLRWGEHRITVGTGHDSLAFLFYKDGIRRVTFLPGFEEEVDRFFDVLTRARTLDRQGDDLVTLLWEQDFNCFRHVYVDILAEGVEIPEAARSQSESIDRERVAADAAEGATVAGGGAPASELTRSIGREEFEETLYFLDDHELRTLQDQVDKEWDRDIRAAVVDALFDRLEDPIPDRRREILDVFQQLLAAALAAGEYAPVARVLKGLDELLARDDVFEPPERESAAAVFDRLSEPELLGSVLESLDDGQVDPGDGALARVFAHLRPAALPHLLGAVAAAQRPEVRERLEQVVAGLAVEHDDALVEVVAAPEAALAAVAARMAGRLGIKAAVPALRRLLDRDEAAVRLAAVEALATLRTGDAMDSLQRALADPEREVRLTAVRGVGELGYQPARASLERVIQSRSFRDADLTEKVAFFEAYGSLGGAADVELLDRTLNRRGFLRRRADPDMRACAALALGRLATPSARAALDRAGDERHPAVRRAVARARNLSAGEAPAGGEGG